MKLSVPTNWQKDLLARLNKESIAEIYGKLKEDIFGGGRASVYLPAVNKKEVKEFVSSAHGFGLKFNYLLNSLCLSNLEWTPKGQREIRAFLDWLAQIGVDSVTVSLPYLLQMIKKCYPDLEVNVSINTDINSVTKAKTWEDLGADQLTLSLNANRDFETLRQIRKNVKCRLQLIANLLCLRNYPFCTYHYVSTSHLSQNSSKINKDLHFTYYQLQCRRLILSEPYRIISSGWIRPEDLKYYEGLGIDRIKLIDRRMKTELILRAVEAYTARSYDGNLFDLFFYRTTRENNQFSKNLIRRLFDHFLSLRSLNLLKIRKEMRSLQIPDSISLDNRKLDGFISYFLTGKCKLTDCRECDYCRRIADNALVIPQEYKEKMLNIYKNILQYYIDGSLFYAGKGAKCQDHW